MTRGEREGPPKEVSAGTMSGATTTPTATTTATEADSSNLECTAWARVCSARPLWRRRRAADRCEPLASGHRDPWQPHRPERLSDVQVDGAVAAAEHLAGHGLTPRFSTDTLRQLWAAGHRDLAVELHELQEAS